MPDEARVGVERYPLLVCDDHGAMDQQPLERDLTQRCPGSPIVGGGCGKTLRAVEAIDPRSLAALIEKWEIRAETATAKAAGRPHD